MIVIKLKHMGLEVSLGVARLNEVLAPKVNQPRLEETSAID